MNHKNSTRLLVQMMTIKIDPGVGDVQERVHDLLKKKKGENNFSRYEHL